MNSGINIDIKNKSGIYEIFNTKNNKRYIGQSQEVRTRLLKHRRELINNQHDNKHLQNSVNKYGINNFQFNLIEYCDVDVLDEKENYYIKYYNSNNTDYGYNYRIDNKTNRGLKWSDEQREKMNKHFNNPDGYWKNHNIPNYVMEKAWTSTRNRIWTEEDRIKHSIAMTGVKTKDTTNMKIAQTGEKNPSAKLSENDVIEIINLINYGYKISDLGLVYGVKYTTISAIKTKRSWKYIDRISVLNNENLENGLLKIKESGENIEPRTN